jgi:hypothetical protein
MENWPRSTKREPYIGMEAAGGHEGRELWISALPRIQTTKQNQH